MLCAGRGVFRRLTAEQLGAFPKWGRGLGARRACMLETTLVISASALQWPFVSVKPGRELTAEPISLTEMYSSGQLWDWEGSSED